MLQRGVWIVQRWFAAGLVLLAWGCDKDPPPPPAAVSASAIASSTAPVFPKRPRIATSLVAGYEKTPIAMVALANPVTLLGSVSDVERVERCDCQRAKIHVTRVVRDDAGDVAAGKELEIVAGAGLLGPDGKQSLWVLRFDETGISGWFRSDSDAAEVEMALSSLAMSFERSDGALSPLGIVTTRDGRGIWHRNGRVGIPFDLDESERASQKSLLDAFGPMTASERPSGSLVGANAYRLRVVGNGGLLEAGRARSAFEAFADRISVRLSEEVALWQSSTVIVARSAPAAPRYRITKVLKNRAKESVSPGDELDLDTNRRLPGPLLLLSSVESRDGRIAATLYRALPDSASSRIEKALSELDRYGLSAR